MRVSASLVPADTEVVSQRTSFLCGLFAGVAQAGLFNPFDRALYLSVKHHRPFLRYENFRQPYSGFLQSVGGRALSGGLYYPLERAFCMALAPSDGPTHNFLAGTAAGAMNAIILNPISAVKYKTWGREQNRGMLTEVITMWREAGIRPFFNGLFPTLLRDVVFGGCYTYLRHARDIPPEHQWVGNMAAAAVATIASGPFNFARNIQYGTRSKRVAPTIPQVLKKLVVKTASHDTIYRSWRYASARLRIGWGTARVAVGMAFGNYVYDQCMIEMCTMR